MRQWLLPLVCLSFTLPSTYARDWTAADGRVLQAEYISSTSTQVKVRRVIDREVLTVPIAALSQVDQQWLAQQGASDPDGPVGLPAEVAKVVQSKGTLIFADDFNREDEADVEDLGPAWWTNSQSRAQGDKQNDLVDGVLVMTVSPRADHAISTRHTVDEPFKDVVVSLKMKLPEEGSLKLAYNDRQDKSVHAGHINGVTIRLNSLKLDDERTGRFNLKYREDKTTPEAKAAFAVSAKQFPLKLTPDEWHEVVTYHNGDSLTVYIDGEQAGTFRSPGFAHATKRDFVFAVPKQALVDDLQIWSIAE